MKFILDEMERPKAERIFVDRVEPRQQFWDAFAKVQQGLEEPYVLHYYGVGGIGKTSLHSQLIRELKHRCPEAKFADLDFDFVERREPYRVMGLLKKKLSQSWGFQFPLFDVACYTFLCRIGEDADKEEIESFVGGSQVLNFLCDAASMVPGASMVSGILKLVDEGVAVARNLFSGKNQQLKALESMDIRQLRDQLPLYFAADLRNNLKKEKHPFVIFLDTYEKLVNEFAGVGDPLQNDLWLRGSGGLIPRLPGVLWVLGGREKLKWSQLDSPGAWDNVLHQYLLGTLAEEDSQEFLRSAGVEDSSVRNKICSLSGGLPVSLDLYVEQYFQQGTVSDTVAPSALHERVVRYMTEEEKTACYLLAVLGQWTQEQALAVARDGGVPLSPALLERICGFSFVLTEDGTTFRMMRNVGEVLRQHCPAALGRSLAAKQGETPKAAAQPVLDFASAPERYVSLLLGTFQEEEPCLTWVLDQLDSPLAALRQRLDLDTYFSVLQLLKEWAHTRCPVGVLEALVEGYNGIGLFYASRPEDSQSALEKVLARLEQCGEVRVLCAVILQYARVTLACLNAVDFVEHVEPLWALFQHEEPYASKVAGQLANAWELMDQPQKAQLWRQRADNGEAAPVETAEGVRDHRLSQIRQDLKELVRQEEISQEEKERIFALLEEGSRLVADRYEPASKEAYLWYLQECQAYLNTGEPDRGLAVTGKLLELARRYYGTDSGAFAMVQMVDGFLRFMSSSAQLDFRSWPDCSPIFSRAYSTLKKRLGEESEFTRQAYVLWKGTDLGSVSIAEYRQQLRDVFDAMERPGEALFPVGDLLDDLEFLPEEIDESPAVEVMASVFGGETSDKPAAQPEPASSADPSPAPQEGESAQADLEVEEGGSITMAEAVRQLVAEYKPADLYTAFTVIPEKKLRNALKTYGGDPKGEMIPYVLCLFDATVLGNAKNGFLLFTSGLLYRESGSRQGEVLLRDLEPFTAEKGFVVLNTKEKPKLATFVSARAEAAVQVLNRILDHLRSLESPEKA